MKIVLAVEWLKASYSDLAVVEEIIDNSFLTHMVAFHCHQCVEKSLKALLEFYNSDVPKKHDLLLLQNLTSQYVTSEYTDTLEDLNELYIDSRYPGDMGLLPYGKPKIEDAKEFYSVARGIFMQVCTLLNISIDEIKSEPN